MSKTFLEALTSVGKNLQSGINQINNTKIDYPVLESEGNTVIHVKYPYGDARRYGAKGDGTTDDTMALQNMINYICANKIKGYIPAGNYRITTKLETPTGSFFYMEGAGAQLTMLCPSYSNDSILELNVEQNYVIQGIGFVYPNVTNDANAKAIDFKVMAYHVNFRNLYFRYGAYAIYQDSSIVPYWDVTFDDLYFSNQTKGCIVCGNGTLAPNIHIGRIYAILDSMEADGCVAHLCCENSTIDCLEVNRMVNSGKLLDFYYGSEVTIGSMKIENAAIPASPTYSHWITGSNIHINIDNLRFFDIKCLNTTSFYIFYLLANSSVHVGNLYLEKRDGSTGDISLLKSVVDTADTSRLIIERFSTTYTGTLDYFAGDSVARRVSLGDVANDKYDVSAMEDGDSITIDGVSAKTRLITVPDNASVTVIVGGNMDYAGIETTCIFSLGAGATVSVKKCIRWMGNTQTVDLETITESKTTRYRCISGTICPNGVNKNVTDYIRVN